MARRSEAVDQAARSSGPARLPGRQTPIYALRLGNHRYPHMKLQIQPWPNDAGFMLSVNTHDQVAGVNLSEVDAQAFRDLQAENQRLKEAIEQAWDEAGLPTFLRYLRDYIESRREAPRRSRRSGRPAVRAGPERPGRLVSRGDRPDASADGPRQEEREGRALPGAARDLDPAAVQLDERLDQAEAQADPALAELVVARGVAERVEAGEERLEEVLLVAGGDADALVADAARGPSPVAPGSAAAASRIVPPSGVNLTALASRLIRTSAILDGSTSSGPRSGLDRRRPPTGRAARDRGRARRWRGGRAARARSARRSSDWLNSPTADQLEHPLDRPGQPPAPRRRSGRPTAARPARHSGPATSSRARSCPARRVTGVFSSWLATSMNAPLSRLASISLALASWSSASSRFFSTIRSWCSTACRTTARSSSGSQGLAR